MTTAVNPHYSYNNHRLLRQKQSTTATHDYSYTQSSSLETETVNPHDYSYNNHRLLRQKQSTHMTTATTNHRHLRKKQSTHMTTATPIIVSRDRNSQPTWLQLHQSSSLRGRNSQPTWLQLQPIIVSRDRNSHPTWLQLQQSSSLETETVNSHDCSYNNHRLSRQKQSTHVTTATLIIVSRDRNSQPTWLQRH